MIKVYQDNRQGNDAYYNMLSDHTMKIYRENSTMPYYDPIASYPYTEMMYGRTVSWTIEKESFEPGKWFVRARWEEGEDTVVFDVPAVDIQSAHTALCNVFYMKDKQDNT